MSGCVSSPRGGCENALQALRRSSCSVEPVRGPKLAHILQSTETELVSNEKFTQYLSKEDVRRLGFIGFRGCGTPTPMGLGTPRDTEDTEDSPGFESKNSQHPIGDSLQRCFGLQVNWFVETHRRKLLWVFTLATSGILINELRCPASRSLWPIVGPKGPGATSQLCPRAAKFVVPGSVFLRPLRSIHVDLVDALGKSVPVQLFHTSMWVPLPLRACCSCGMTEHWWH